MFTVPTILYSILNNISFLFIALAQTENNTVSEGSTVGQQDTNESYNSTIAQILPSWNQDETRDTIIGYVNNVNHFDCSLSALGLARSVVMDYNPSNGDTISGPCKIVNTIGNNGDSTITLPDTEETTSTEVIPGSRLAHSKSHPTCPLVSGFLILAQQGCYASFGCELEVKSKYSIQNLRYIIRNRPDVLHFAN